MHPPGREDDLSACERPLADWQPAAGDLDAAAMRFAARRAAGRRGPPPGPANVTACPLNDLHLTNSLTPVRRIGNPSYPLPRGRIHDPTAPMVRTCGRRSAGAGPPGRGQTSVTLGRGPFSERHAANCAAAGVQISSVTAQYGPEGGQRRADLPAPGPRAGRRGAEILDG